MHNYTYTGKIIFTGMEGIDIPIGSVVKVIGAPNTTNEGDVLLRIDNQQHPFISLYASEITDRYKAVIWGNALGSYVFQYLGYVLDYIYGYKTLIINE